MLTIISNTDNGSVSHVNCVLVRESPLSEVPLHLWATHVLYKPPGLHMIRWDNLKSRGQPFYLITRGPDRRLTITPSHIMDY